jgi:hypothetical protein
MEPLLPKGRRGMGRGDDRRVISDIMDRLEMWHALAQLPGRNWQYVIDPSGSNGEAGRAGVRTSSKRLIGTASVIAGAIGVIYGMHVEGAFLGRRSKMAARRMRSAGLLVDVPPKFTR